MKYSRFMFVTVIVGVILMSVGSASYAAWICPSGKTQCQNICWNTFTTTTRGNSCLSCSTGEVCTLYPLPIGGGACEGPGEDFYADLQDCLNRCDIVYQCYPVT